MDSGFTRDSLKVLLDRLGDVDDPRVPEKVRFPLDEVLFLVTCATIRWSALRIGQQYSTRSLVNKPLLQGPLRNSSIYQDLSSRLIGSRWFQIEQRWVTGLQ